MRLNKVAVKVGGQKQQINSNDRIEGKAFAIPQGDSYEVFPTEGGHTNFAPDNQIQMELLQYLLSEGKVDTEAIVSDMGIVTIFKFLKEHKFPAQIAEDILTQANPAKAIATEAGKENPNFLCQKTMEIFIEAEAYGATGVTEKKGGNRLCGLLK